MCFLVELLGLDSFTTPKLLYYNYNIYTFRYIYIYTDIWDYFISPFFQDPYEPISIFMGLCQPPGFHFFPKDQLCEAADRTLSERCRRPVFFLGEKGWF